MRIRVNLVPSEELNAGTAEVGFVNVECGKGTQIVKVACPRGRSSHGRTRRHTHLHPVSGPPGGE